MSIHRYDNGSFFPNSKAANYTSVGLNAGEGFNVNVPWNKVNKLAVTKNIIVTPDAKNNTYRTYCFID